MVLAACGGDATDAPALPDDVQEDVETDISEDTDVAEGDTSDTPEVEDTDEETEVTQPPPPPPRLDPAIVEALRADDETVADTSAAESFLVGFATTPMPWRAGAKPGQIGTEALPARDALLAGSLGVLLPILARGRNNPERYLREMSAWYLETLDEALEWIEPGVYSDLFEPGIGFELPPAVHAAVLSSGETHVAIVSADLYLPHEQIHRRIAHLVAQETGIARDNLFISATHSHSAPHAMAPPVGIWTFGDRFDVRHWVYATRKIADTVVEAWNDRRPAQVRTGRTQYAGVQRNIVGGGTAQVAPAPGEPREEVQVGYPSDHVDDDLVLIRLEERDTGEPIVSLFVLGMHPETLRDNHGIISGEFPRHAEAKVRDLTGAPALWLSGALGDIEPDRGNVRPEADFWRRGFEAMDRMTDEIAAAVAALHESLESETPESDPVLRNLARDVPGPADHPLPRSTYLGPDYPMVRLIHDSMRIRFHLVRIHDVLLAGTPGEIPTDMSFNLRTRMETGATSAEVFQGYVWPDAPEWVRERIEQNFSTTVASEEAQVPIVSVISLVNTYAGYVVTRWEFENRSHYRQSLTTFGPETADYMNTWILSLNEELHGGVRREEPWPTWLEDDMDGFDRATLWFREAEEGVPAFMRALPASDPDEVATILEAPQFREADASNTDRFPHRVDFSWVGGTNDVDVPQVWVERFNESEDTWETVAHGPGRELFVLWEAPDRWTAQWRRPPEDADTYRFRVEGTWRTDTPGTSDPHPWFDPDGANDTYSVVSEAFPGENAQ